MNGLGTKKAPPLQVYLRKKLDLSHENDRLRVERKALQRSRALTLGREAGGISAPRFAPTFLYEKIYAVEGRNQVIRPGSFLLNSPIEMKKSRPECLRRKGFTG